MKKYEIIPLNAFKYDDDKIINNYNIKKTNINYLNYISLVKIISTVFVVMMHTNRHYYVFNRYWESTNLITGIIYCAVPLFCLCIGATLLDFNKRYGLKIYYQRRIVKIIIPIIGWNFIFYFYRVYFLKNFKKGNLNFVYIYHLYFDNLLYPITNSLRIFLIGYMIIPLISTVEAVKKIKIYFYCFIVLFINQSLIPYLINSFKPTLKYWPYNYNFGYIIYLFAGYIIQNYKFKSLYKFLIYIFGIIAVITRIKLAHYKTMKNKKVDSTQLGYVNLPCVIYSCSIFLFIKEYSFLFFKIINIKYINKIATLSMGPFFLHYLVIWTFQYFFKFNEYSFAYRFYGAFIISFICFIITSIFKKIPLIKHLTP